MIINIILIIKIIIVYQISLSNNKMKCLNNFRIPTQIYNKNNHNKALTQIKIRIIKINQINKIVYINNNNIYFIPKLKERRQINNNYNYKIMINIKIKKKMTLIHIIITK